MKFKIPEIKIPKVSIPKLHRKAEDDEQISYEEVDPEQNGEGVDDSNTADNEVFDELDSAEAPEEAPAAEPQPQNKAQKLRHGDIRGSAAHGLGRRDRIFAAYSSRFGAYCDRKLKKLRSET